MLFHSEIKKKASEIIFLGLLSCFKIYYKEREREREREREKEREIEREIDRDRDR